MLFFGQDIYKLSDKRLAHFRNACISFLHQEYNLLEDETVIENVAYPLLIQGKNKENAYKEARILLEKLNFNKDFEKQYVSTLSGGEKQRISLLRCLITDPKIIFADEPTGALDSVNAKTLIKILKSVSKNRLVLIVSHDYNLVSPYADRIITLSDGGIINDQNINESKNDIPFIEEKRKHLNSFVLKKAKYNLKKKWRRNILPILGLSFSMTFLLLVLGFNNQAPKTINCESQNIFNIGTSVVSNERSYPIPGSAISLVKTSRPSNEEMMTLVNKKNYYSWGYNFGAIFSENPLISFNDINFQNISYLPVYRFNKNYCKSSLLQRGRLGNDLISECVINNLAYDAFFKKTNLDPLGKYITVSCSAETRYYPEKEPDKCIVDVFAFYRKVKIVGIVNEVTALNVPKIYFSYISLEDYLTSTYLNNLSIYLGENFSWYERIAQEKNTASLSTYSNYLFLKNIADVNLLFDDVENIKDTKITNMTVSLSKALSDLINTASLGFNIFIVIALSGALLILIVSSISNYLKDKRNIAIEMSLGACRDDINQAYCFEGIGLSFVALTFAVGFSFGISFLINKIMSDFYGIGSMISIPYLSLCNIEMLLPTILIFSAILIPIITTYIPISCYKKISIKDEIKNND